MLSPILDGLLFGLSISIPFGPVSLSCVQYSLSDGPRSGIASGLGATSAHALLAIAAVTSVGAAIAEAAAVGPYARLASAAVLILLGLRTLFGTRRAARVQTRSNGRTAYVAGLTLALSNPMTIVPYLALAAALAAHQPTNQIRTMSLLVAGDIAGIFAWYLLISIGASWLRSRVGHQVLNWLNVSTGGILVGFGVLALVG